MPVVDLSSYHQANGTTSDGNKFDNLIDAIQAALNALDNNNIAPGAAIALSKLSGTFTTYTPTWTCSGVAPVLGNGTLGGTYVQIGKLTFGQISLIAGSTTTFGTGNWYFTYPAALQAGVNTIGTGKINDASAAQEFPIYVTVIDTAKFTVNSQVVSGANIQGGAVSSTSPYTWASGDTLLVGFWYWAA